MLVRRLQTTGRILSFATLRVLVSALVMRPTFSR